MGKDVLRVLVSFRIQFAIKSIRFVCFLVEVFVVRILLFFLSVIVQVESVFNC